jgi:hypothetical protein
MDLDQNLAGLQLGHHDFLNSQWRIQFFKDSCLHRQSRHLILFSTLVEILVLEFSFALLNASPAGGPAFQDNNFLLSMNLLDC